MENYPDSATSSPRSVEQTWESDQKVKFMVSYNGQIQPRPHDNLLSYIGGDTKILSVDRSVKFNLIYSKLSSLLSNSNPHSTHNFTFKYQLPGEDLDALISVTNDDDLQHMMHEYDRLLKSGSLNNNNKPARLRLFLFFNNNRNSATAFSSEPASDPTEVVVSPQMQMHNNVDFLFGLDKVVPNPVQTPGPNPVQNSDMIHEMNRIHHLQMQQQQLHQEYHQPPPPPQQPPQLMAANVQQPPPPGYWQQIEQQQQLLLLQQQQEYHQQPPPPPQQQPLYMMHAPPPPPYYQQIQQRMQSDQGVYMEQPVYTTPATIPAAYDNVTGRQVYYAAPTPQGGGVVAPPYSGVATTVASGGEMRGSGDGKVVQKIMTNPTVL